MIMIIIIMMMIIMLKTFFNITDNNNHHHHNNKKPIKQKVKTFVLCIQGSELHPHLLSSDGSNKSLNTSLMNPLHYLHVGGEYFSNSFVHLPNISLCIHFKHVIRIRYRTRSSTNRDRFKKSYDFSFFHLCPVLVPGHVPVPILCSWFLVPVPSSFPVACPWFLSCPTYQV